MDEYSLIISSILEFEHGSYHKPLFRIKNGTIMEKVILIFYAVAPILFEINIHLWPIRLEQTIRSV